MPQVQPEECQNELESSMSVDILWQKFYRIPILKKIKSGQQLTATYSSGHGNR